MLEVVLASLDDDKAEEVVTIDIRGRASFADHLVIASGRSGRQVAAMADHLAAKLKGLGLKIGLEGMGQADWVLIDAGDVVIHLFRPEVRAFYNLERMWSGEAPAKAAGALTA